MISLRRAYDYLFYKLYRSFEAAPSKWLSDWKALFVLMVIEIWIFLAALNYFSVLFPSVVLSDQFLVTTALFLVLVLALIKYFGFEHNGRWKTVVRRCDKLPPGQNRRGSYVLWSVILLVLINLVFSFFLLSTQE